MVIYIYTYGSIIMIILFFSRIINDLLTYRFTMVDECMITGSLDYLPIMVKCLCRLNVINGLPCNGEYDWSIMVNDHD